MGVILSRIWKKKSTIEVLEKLENDIKEIEEIRANTQRKYKKITKSLLAYSLVLYVLCGVIFYFQYSSTLKEKLLYLVPLAISPLLLYIVKRITSWYFVRLLNKNQIRLNEMKKEKKRILEEVMDKESYKVAKQILEKYSNENVSKPNVNLQLAPVNQSEDRLRRRIVNTSNLPKPPAPGSIVPNYSGIRAPQLPIPAASANRAFPAPVNVMACLPAPVLPLNRGYMDRVVEYLIGDGPNNRYALICTRCHSHNGMALKEEFEYIGFKCCYCFNYNPARKIRPEAPKLESPLSLRQQSESDSDSKTSGENSDAEPKPQVEFDKENKYQWNISNGSFCDNSKSPDETALKEENISGSIARTENDEEKEREDEEPIAENSEGSTVAAENISNQPESDANCDQSDLSSSKS